MRVARWLSRLWIVGLLSAAACSTGPPTGEVSGTVKVDDKPVQRGSIGFVPVDGKGQTAGGPITNGQYSVKKVSTGKMKVEIRMPIVVDKQKDYDAEGGKWYPLEDESLPAKYHNDSELTFEVKRGKNEKDWELKKK